MNKYIQGLLLLRLSFFFLPHIKVNVPTTILQYTGKGRCCVDWIVQYLSGQLQLLFE